MARGGRDATEEGLLPRSTAPLASGLLGRDRGGRGVIPLAHPDLRRRARLPEGTWSECAHRPNAGGGAAVDLRRGKPARAGRLTEWAANPDTIAPNRIRPIQ